MPPSLRSTIEHTDKTIACGWVWASVCIPSTHETLALKTRVHIRQPHSKTSDDHHTYTVKKEPPMINSFTPHKATRT
eukprot:c44912_g1_i1 orf=108-338(-)